MVENKKYHIVAFIAIFLIGLMAIMLVSCNLNPNSKNNANAIKCEKTDVDKYKDYLDLPENKSQFANVKIALILDTSGSMEGNKLERAKESSTKLIMDFDPQINIGLFRFSTNVPDRLARSCRW